MATFADLQAAVTAEETVEKSIIALVNTLAGAAVDPTALNNLVAQINADSAALAAAVTAGTPAQTPAPAAPVVQPAPATTTTTTPVA